MTPNAYLIYTTEIEFSKYYFKYMYIQVWDSLIKKKFVLILIYLFI